MSNNSGKRKVEVSLLGQRFQLRSDKSDEYLQGLANFVATKLEEIRKASRIASSHHIGMLLSLNLADQLFEKEQELERLKNSLESRAEEALREVQNVLAMLPESAPTEVRDDEV